MNEVRNEWKFGVLRDSEAHGTGGGWELAPLPDSKAVYEQWSDRRHGHLVCPNPAELEAANRWKIPPTHRLTYLGTPTDDLERFAAFSVYALGLLHAQQLQLSDWFVTGNVSGGRTHNLQHTSHSFKSDEPFLEVVSDWYLRKNEKLRTVATSALYLHGSVKSYTWPWEQFAWEYAILDACWLLAGRNRHEVPHGKRIEELAAMFELKGKVDYFKQGNDDYFERWVDQRNDLMHEVTWGKEIPGHIPSGEPSRLIGPLGQFTAALLLAILGYSSPVLKDYEWWSWNPVALDPPP